MCDTYLSALLYLILTGDIDYGGMELTGQIFAAQTLPLYRKYVLTVTFSDAKVFQT